MRKQYHYVYSTTNTVNGKQYIGKHSTFNLNDGYLGSGTRLKRAIVKYGIDKFNKEILQFFDTAKEALLFEKEIVNHELLKNSNYYNLAIGGSDGNSRNFLTGLTPTENALKAAKTLKSRPEVLMRRNLKVGEKARQKLLEDPNYFADKVAKMNLVMRGATKDTSPHIRKQIENRRRQHLDKMNRLLLEVRKLDHLAVKEINVILGVSGSTIYRCRLRNKLNLRWEQPIPNK